MLIRRTNMVMLDEEAVLESVTSPLDNTDETYQRSTGHFIETIKPST